MFPTRDKYAWGVVSKPEIDISKALSTCACMLKRYICNIGCLATVHKKYLLPSLTPCDVSTDDEVIQSVLYVQEESINIYFSLFLVLFHLNRRYVYLCTVSMCRSCSMYAGLTKRRIWTCMHLPEGKIEESKPRSSVVW